MGSKNMKLIATLAAAATAQQLGAPVNPLMPAMPALPAMPGMGGMNPLMMMTLLGDDSSMDSDLLMMMMMGGQGGVGQMNPLISPCFWMTAATRSTPPSSRRSAMTWTPVPRRPPATPTSSWSSTQSR